MSAVDVGSLVMIERTARPTPRRVVHLVARVRTGPAAYPYVLACGRAIGLPLPATEDASRCAGCWPVREAEQAFDYGEGTIKSGAPATLAVSAASVRGRVSEPQGGPNQ